MRKTLALGSALLLLAVGMAMAMPQAKTAERPTQKAPFGTPYVHVLAVVDGPDRMAVHRIGQTETVIGRGDKADFRVEDDQVSHCHCMIRVEGSVCTLVELGSLNGTRLNARELRSEMSTRMRHLDVVQLGETRIMLLSGKCAERLSQD